MPGHGGTTCRVPLIIPGNNDSHCNKIQTYCYTLRGIARETRQRLPVVRRRVTGYKHESLYQDKTIQKEKIFLLQNAGTRRN